MADSFGENNGGIDNSVIRPPETQLRQDPITLDISDAQLVKIIDKRISESKSFYDNKLDLKNRRKINKEYLVGNQVDFNKLKDYNARYIDNLIYEAEGTIKPIAISRLPDLIVKPGDDTDEQKKTAEDLTDIMNSDIRKRENRQVLGLAFRHHPVYFTACIKAVWNPQLGENGNYQFKVVHPDNIVMDHTASSNNSRDMDYIAEATELSVKEIVMRFPDKKEKILKIMDIDPKSPNEEKMASKQKIWEVWFTWYKEQDDPVTGEQKYERIEGVLWKYKTLLLDKMLHPYWDWTGKKRLFKYERDTKKKIPLSDEEIQAVILGQNKDVQMDTVYRNHFENPEKPYYFFGYDQWGEHPMDITSRIEQVLKLQDNVNKRGRQITEMNDRARGKDVFSTDSGITKEDVANTDFQDPDQSLVVDGNLSQTYAHIQPPTASAPMYTEQEQERNKAFSKMGTHSTTRGEINKNKPATSDFIAREQDFGRIDDIVEETINPASEWMANWAMQFIKLFYKNEHMVRVLGSDGAVAHKRIKSDSIEDGMEVEVSASGVDKQQRKSEAYQRAQMKLTDPLTFFIDTDASDPIGRTEKLMTFLASPELYLQQIVKGRSTVDMVQALNGQQQLPSGNPNIPPPPQAPQTGFPQTGGQGGGGSVMDLMRR